MMKVVSDKKSRKNPYLDLIFGAICGTFSRTVVAPINRIKIIM